MSGEMVEIKVNRRWSIKVPAWLAEWEVWDIWEKERLACMALSLSEEDTLLDIGAEAGWMSVIFGQMVGPASVCLFEPSPEYWPLIRAIWKANHELDPRSCWAGLVSDRTLVPPATDFDYQPKEGVWPGCALGEVIDGGRPYRYLHGHGAFTPQVRIDDWCLWTGIQPTAVTMDCEGAELAILRGAEQLLTDQRPMLFLSVHPHLMARDHDEDPAWLFDFLGRLGYDSKHLTTDHEEHWIAWHPGSPHQPRTP